jgi:hypothetical protein
VAIARTHGNHPGGTHPFRPGWRWAAATRERHTVVNPCGLWDRVFDRRSKDHPTNQRSVSATRVVKPSTSFSGMAEWKLGFNCGTTCWISAFETRVDGCKQASFGDRLNRGKLGSDLNFQQFLDLFYSASQ